MGNFSLPPFNLSGGNDLVGVVDVVVVVVVIFMPTVVVTGVAVDISIADDVTKALRPMFPLATSPPPPLLSSLLEDEQQNEVTRGALGLGGRSSADFSFRKL